MVARGALGSPKARGGHGGCRGCGGRREAFLLTLAAPCIVALFIGSLASCVQLAAADAEEYPEYHRPTKSEAAPHKVSQPDPESEDAFVDSMLDDIRDLESERQRWFREREEAKRLQQEQQEQQEQKLQAELAELATLAGQQQQQAKQAEQNTLAAQQQQQQAEQGSSAKQQQKQADEHAALVQQQQQQQQQAERSALARQQQNQPNAKQQEKKTEQSVLARQLKQQADQTAIVKQQQQASQQSALAMQQQNKEAEQAALARQQPQEADLTAFAYDDAPAYVAALLGEHKPLAKQQQQQQAEKAALNRQQQQQAEQAALARQQKETERAALARQQQQLADQDAFARQQQQQLAEQNALARQQQLAKQNAFARQQQQQLAEQNAFARQQQQQLAEQNAFARQQQQQLAEQNAFARQQQQQLAEQRPFARLLVGNPAAADAVVTDLERIEQEDGLDGLDSLDIDSDLEDLTRALKQEPQVPPLDAALLRAYLLERPLPPRSLERLMSSLPSLMGSFASSSQRQMEMQRQAQQQQRDQDRYQQQLFEQQHEQLSKDMRAKMLAGMEEPAGQQPPFTYSFATPKGSSPFASSPADTKYYQQDVRLTGLLSPQGVVQPPQDEQDEDAGAGLGGARGASSEQHDLADDQQDGDEDLGTVDSDDFPHYLTDPEAIALRQQQQQLQQQQRLRQQQQLQLQQQRLQQQQHGVTAPVSPDQQPAHQGKPSLTRDSKLDDDRSTNLSSHEYPVVKKQLTFPKDHWFFGMDDVGKLAIFIGCSIAVSSLILGFIVWQYRLHRNAKAAADVEYPAYGVTGPNKDISPTGPPGPPGDRRLAQSAQMYHYQHQKQQILAMESRASGGRRGSMSEAESEDENEEGDYTVYECPGLAPTQEMEVKNPLFHDDPTPATPAPGEASQDSDGLSVESGGTKRTSVDGGRFDGKPSKQPANSSSRSSGRP